MATQEAQTEILSIPYHTKRLLLKALNSQPTKLEAAEKLGISERSIHRWIADFKIVQEKTTGKYLQLNEKINEGDYAARNFKF